MSGSFSRTVKNPFKVFCQCLKIYLESGPFRSASKLAGLNKPSILSYLNCHEFTRLTRLALIK